MNIFNHVKLTTLNISNWPDWYCFGKKGTFYTTMQPRLQGVVRTILDYGRHTVYRPGQDPRRLELLALGTRDRSRYRDVTQPLPRYFVEGHVETLGRRRKVAWPIRLKEAYIEGLGVDILHHEWRCFDERTRHESEGSAVFYDDDEATSKRRVW